MVIPARRVARWTIRAAAVAVEALPVGGNEDRAFAPFADGEVDSPGRPRRQRDGHDLAALARIVSVRWPRSSPSASMLAPVASDTRSPFKRQQRDEGVLGRRPEARRHEQRSHLVAVKSGGMRLLVHPGPPHVHRR